MQEDIKCNILIVGKTGAGKGALLNYLCGKTVAETGCGKPQTPKGIFKYTTNINGQEIRIFDSWGIEPGKVDCWKVFLNQHLQERGIQEKPSEWFHSVIYCIEAGRHRVENIDIEIIQRFLKEDYVVTIVLTKADQIDEDEKRKMKNVVLNGLKDYIPTFYNGKINIIATCAISEKTRSGEIQPFGKEELQRAILEGWMKSVYKRLPNHVFINLKELVKQWVVTESNKIKENTSFDSIKYLKNTVDTDVKKLNLKRRGEEILQDAFENCQESLKAWKKTIEHENILSNSLDSINTTIVSSYNNNYIENVVMVAEKLYNFYKMSELISYISEQAEMLIKECEEIKKRIELQISIVLTINSL